MVNKHNIENKALRNINSTLKNEEKIWCSESASRSFSTNDNRC